MIGLLNGNKPILTLIDEHSLLTMYIDLPSRRLRVNENIKRVNSLTYNYLNKQIYGKNNPIMNHLINRNAHSLLFITTEYFLINIIALIY